jgi:hypothetical protein
MASRKPKKDWLKALQKQKRKRFEGLRHQLAHSPFAPDGIVIEPAGKEKMSEVLEDFVEPYLDWFEGEEGYRGLLTLALLAWNAALRPEDQQDAMIDDVLAKALPPGSDEEMREMRALVEAMVERKLTDFASNRRAIISFELRNTGGGLHLSVASTLGD